MEEQRGKVKIIRLRSLEKGLKVRLPRTLCTAVYWCIREGYNKAGSWYVGKIANWNQLLLLEWSTTVGKREVRATDRRTKKSLCPPPPFQSPSGLYPNPCPHFAPLAEPNKEQDDKAEIVVCRVSASTWRREYRSMGLKLIDNSLITNMGRWHHFC